MQNQLQKAIDLAKKTGDRIIVLDSQKNQEAYVVMPLDEYEKLAIGRNEVRGLTEDELLDKINRDIAIWKSEQDFDEIKDNNYSNVPDNLDSTEDDIFCSQPRKMKSLKKHWNIPKDRKESAEEVIEEDRQYLEMLA